MVLHTGNEAYMKTFRQGSVENQSISQRLALFLLTSVLIVSVIAVTAVYRVVSEAANQSIEQKADETLAYLVGSLEMQLWSFADEDIRTIGRAVSNDGSVVRLVVKNSVGQVIFSLEKEDGNGLINRSATVFHKYETQVAPIGEVSLSLTSTLYKERNQQLLFFLMIIISLILFSVLIVSVISIRTFLSKPLTSLSNFAARFASGSYDTSGYAIPYLEFQPLGKALTQMARTIEQQIKEISEAEAKYRNIVESAIEGIYQTTVEGRFLGANSAMIDILGYDSFDDLAACAVDISRTLYVNPEDRHKLVSLLLERGGVTGYEVQFRRKDERVIWGSISVRLVRDEEGNVPFIEGFLTDITERKLAEENLRRLNRELRAISNCNQTLIRAEDEQALLGEICRIVCDEAGYCLAWVGYAEHDEARSVRSIACAGSDSEYVENIKFTWDENSERGQGPVGKAIRSGEIVYVLDCATDPSMAPWREKALRYGFRSVIALPLKNESAEVFGVLVIYSSEIVPITQNEIRLLEELSGDLAFGIVSLRIRAGRNKADEQLRIAATAFEAQEGIIITDARQSILRVNRAFTEITGFTHEDVAGDTPRLLQSGLHDKAFFQSMWEHIHRDGFWQGEIWNRRKNGEIYPEWLNITAVRNTHGEISHYVGTLLDITERKAAEKRIEHLAFYDYLTQLPNRRLLMDRLQQAMASSTRSQQMGALLFIDLDNFKLLNDTCGHDIGDQLLIEVANRLNLSVRDGDTISRLGGDEFVVMLIDLSNNAQEAAAQAKRVGEKIQAALELPYTISGRVHHSSPSIGITLFLDSEKSVDDLLKQADIAMYQAKSAGRNTVRFFDPEMQAALAARANLDASLRRAITEHQFVLHFQPQFVGDKKIVGAEALLRWQHPVCGMVSPAQYIPLAEETGLILPIGQWVLETACARLAAWAGDPSTRNLDLAVNVSARQFRQAGFVDQVRQALANAGAPATRLKLELTESLLLDNIKDTIEKMQALRSLGVGFSIDDFGTGYSSLSYLTQLPLDQLKIDQSFVRNLPDNPSDAAVVQTIITLASSLGLSVIAEGVETEAQRSFLEQNGCSTYQGYLFSSPVEIAELERLLIAQ